VAVEFKKSWKKLTVKRIRSHVRSIRYGSFFMFFFYFTVQLPVYGEKAVC